ncbi:MAG: hypothetical protein WC964_00945 [Acholeplasmataceae bacterium]
MKEGSFIKVIVFVLMGLLIVLSAYSIISLIINSISLISNVDISNGTKITEISRAAIPLFIYIGVIVFLFIVSNRMIVKVESMNDKSIIMIQIVTYIIISGVSVYFLISGAQYLSNPSSFSSVIFSLVYTSIYQILIIFWSALVLYSSYTINQKSV